MYYFVHFFRTQKKDVKNIYEKGLWASSRCYVSRQVKCEHLWSNIEKYTVTLLICDCENGFLLEPTCTEK